MNFQTWRKEIARRSLACGGGSPDAKHVDRVIAAAAAVIAQRGEQWAMSNPSLFQNEVIKKAGTWASIGFAIMRLFGMSHPLLIVASYVLPVVLNWIQEHVSLTSMGACTAMDWKQLGIEAEEYGSNIGN
jgi:hypothetical protein